MGVTALRAPTPDIPTHQILLTQLKEETEVGRRIRGNPDDSFVTLGELISTGILKYIGKTVSPGNKLSGGGLSTVNVVDSITGDGSVGSPLKLVGDTASPTASQYYGTNAGSTRGWYNLPGGGGGSLTVTDGSHSVASTTSITFSGATVSGTTPNAVVTVSGGGSSALPGTIPDLVLWIETDNILGGALTQVGRLQEKTPWIGGVAAQANTSVQASIDPVQLNSLNVLKWPASSSNGIYSLTQAFAMPYGATMFVVVKGANTTGNQAIFGCSANGGLSLYLTISGTASLQLVQTGISIIGASTATWTAGTFFQANVTYNPSTGGYVFRQARAAAGSGTGATGVGTGPQAFIAADLLAAVLNSASIAAVIAYNRVLSGAEITAIENYLFAKWGV